MRRLPPGTGPGGENGRRTRTGSKRENSARPPKPCPAPEAQFENPRSNPVHPPPAPYPPEPNDAESERPPNLRPRRNGRRARTRDATKRKSTLYNVRPHSVRPRRTTPVNRHPKLVRRRHPTPGHPGCNDLPDPRRLPAFAAAAHLAGRAIRQFREATLYTLRPRRTRPSRTAPAKQRPELVLWRHPTPGHPGCNDLPKPRRLPAFAAAAHLAGRAIRESAKQPCTPSASATPSASTGPPAAHGTDAASPPNPRPAGNQAATPRPTGSEIPPARTQRLATPASGHLSRW